MTQNINKGSQYQVNIEDKDKLITCPVCDSSASLVRNLSKDFIENCLCNYYKVPYIDSDLEIKKYDLMKCNNCSLEFSYPLNPGTNNFYKWITNRVNYYPSHRWEWDFVTQEIKYRNYEEATLLEIGCGSGNFLSILKKLLPNLVTIGLDTTDTSVKECRNKGLNVKCETIESFLEKSDNKSQSDYVVAFHCLEHVNNPKALIKSMASALKPTGSIFVSTPYSPMSFETKWFDPLNHPPHHLIRLNSKAYKELGKQLNLNVKFYMPKPSNSLSRTLRALNYSWFGPAKAKPRRYLIISALSRPWDFVSEWIRQIKREKVVNQVAADTVLVEFSFMNK